MKISNVTSGSCNWPW